MTSWRAWRRWVGEAQVVESMAMVTVHHARAVLRHWEQLALAELDASPDDPAPEPARRPNSLRLGLGLGGERSLDAVFDALTGAEVDAILRAEVERVAVERRGGSTATALASSSRPAPPPGPDPTIAGRAPTSAPPPEPVAESSTSARGCDDGAVRVVTDRERRHRLGVRHGLADGAGFGSPEDATRALTVLHATEPPTPYLSLHARVPDLSFDAVERALYRDRSLVKQLSMRRTLFVYPRDLLPAAWGSAAARTAARERTRLARDIAAAGLAADPQRWIAEATEATLIRLGEADHEGLTGVELREQVPEVAGSYLANPDKRYAATVHLAPRLLTLLGAEGRVVRATNAGHWRLSKPRWITTARWLDGDVPEPLDAASGYAELVSRWLWTFGPGTVEDLRWWLGSTKGAVREALAAIGAVEIALEDGTPAWLRADDVDPVADPGPWTALLPVLDATIMGWKARDWYLDDRAPLLFDTAGNAGTSAWVDGRVVGVWVQDPDGVVEVRLLEAQPASVRRRLRAQAERLTTWLAGERVSTVYPSTAMKDPARTRPL